MYLSIIIPAYNEEKRLPSTIREISSYLKDKDYSYEILVVNDGSTDKTAEVVRGMTTEIKGLKLIDNEENKGKGGVVKQGMLEAKGKYRLFTDADNSTSIDHIERMWPLFNEGFNIVIGTRDSKDAPGAKQAVPQSFIKRSLGNIGNLLIQLIAVPGIWDTQCGFKAFTDQLAESVFPKQKIDRWGFDIEILFLSRMLGYKIGIIPVNWVNDPDSKVSLKGYLQVFKELFQVRLNQLKGVYK
ncbi:MAG: dolichyl-phosphate beta-glucosyltransferase [Minisyncoccales bacterium]|jgi:dolichyl-phosphate beta-glucosyltransferase